MLTASRRAEPCSHGRELALFDESEPSFLNGDGGKEYAEFEYVFALDGSEIYETSAARDRAPFVIEDRAAYHV